MHGGSRSLAGFELNVVRGQGPAQAPVTWTPSESRCRVGPSDGPASSTKILLVFANPATNARPRRALKPLPSAPLPFVLPKKVTMRDARSDATFKILFGEGGEHRTISFINAVLQPTKREDRVSSIEVLDSTLNSIDDRQVHFDVGLEYLCDTVGGKRFIVEMQRARERGHTDRWVYFCARELGRIGKQNYERIQARRTSWNV